MSNKRGTVAMTNLYGELRFVPREQWYEYKANGWYRCLPDDVTSNMKQSYWRRNDGTKDIGGKIQTENMG